MLKGAIIGLLFSIPLWALIVAIIIAIVSVVF